MKKIARLTKPTDVSTNNLSTVITNIHDKINELIVAINSKTSKSVPRDSEGKDSDMRIIDDQTDGKVKIGIKTKGSWHTIEATED